MKGMTTKQIARHEFFEALEAYKKALASKNSKAIVLASVRIHKALSGVPKSYKTLVNGAFREAGAKEAKYTLADLESVSAVTAEFFADRPRQQKFYDTHCDELSGIPGVWQYVRDAALILEQEAKTFGEAGEDYDWMQTVQGFAERLYAYPGDGKKGELILRQRAREVLTANKY